MSKYAKTPELKSDEIAAIKTIDSIARSLRYNLLE